MAKMTEEEADVREGIHWEDAPARSLTADPVLHEFFDESEIETVAEVGHWLAELDSLPPGHTNKQMRDLLSSYNLAMPEDERQPEEIVLAWLEPAKPTELTEEEAERLREYDASTLTKINDLTKVAGELGSRWEGYKERASMAKKEFEMATEQLMNYIRDRQLERTPNDLFSKKPEEATPAGQVPEDLWKSYPMTFENFGAFGLTEKDIERLNSGDTKSHGPHPINTVGDMTRFITPNVANPAYARTLIDFKGFGEKGVERWQEAETKFWAWWKNGGDVEFAEEKGLLTDTQAAKTDISRPNTDEVAAKPAEEPSLTDIDGGNVNPLPDADTKPKRKRGGR